MRSILGIVLLWLLTLAGCGEGGGENVVHPIEQTIVACAQAPDPEACVAAANATLSASRPTSPPPDPAVRELLIANDVVRQLLGDGEEREDFWLIIDAIPAGSPHGDVGGMAVIVFGEPVSYAGLVPTRSDPCSGHYGLDERVDPDDPCLDEPREYGAREVEFTDVRVVHTQVDTGRGGVVWLFPDDTPDHIVEDMIRWAEETQY